MSRDGQKIDFARRLRRDQMDAEGLFWSQVRNRKLGGYKFKRQATIGPYIADFYCAEKKLVIELDGDQHADNVAYDVRRTDYFASQGITVIRYWNHEIFGETDFLFDALLHRIESM